MAQEEVIAVLGTENALHLALIITMEKADDLAVQSEPTHCTAAANAQGRRVALERGMIIVAVSPDEGTGYADHQIEHSRAAHIAAVD